MRPKAPADSAGLKEVCKGHSILNDVTAQTGESDHLYAKASGIARQGRPWT